MSTQDEETTVSAETDGYAAPEVMPSLELVLLRRREKMEPKKAPCELARTTPLDCRVAACSAAEAAEGNWLHASWRRLRGLGEPIEPEPLRERIIAGEAPRDDGRLPCGTQWVVSSAAATQSGVSRRSVLAIAYGGVRDGVQRGVDGGASGNRSWFCARARTHRARRARNDVRRGNSSSLPNPMAVVVLIIGLKEARVVGQGLLETGPLDAGIDRPQVRVAQVSIDRRHEQIHRCHRVAHSEGRVVGPEVVRRREPLRSSPRGEPRTLQLHLALIGLIMTTSRRAARRKCSEARAVRRVGWPGVRIQICV